VGKIVWSAVVVLLVAAGMVGLYIFALMSSDLS
jgi:hypothetical protein